ncbi:hypothetical protein GCM10020221_26360 [Streptomyces thioluteus]|uniref:Uncharacterized protein n=1 Tax=Streptomyces thioluteus TaxID=66431 RepID=A0ABP6JD07_STRTU
MPTSQTTRAAITVVLPEPAPATITWGAGGAVMQAVCSGVKGDAEQVLELLGVGEARRHVPHGNGDR